MSQRRNGKRYALRFKCLAPPLKQVLGHGGFREVGSLYKKQDQKVGNQRKAFPGPCSNVLEKEKKNIKKLDQYKSLKRIKQKLG